NDTLPINDSNRITGQHSFGVDAAGFIWDPDHGVNRPLGTVEGAISSSGAAINNLDHIVGSAGFSNGSHHVFLWTKHDGISDLGSPTGAFYSAPTSINDHDEIVGSSDVGTNGTAFYWNPRTGFRTLATIGVQTYALRVNNIGNIVGYVELTPASYH